MHRKRESTRQGGRGEGAGAGLDENIIQYDMMRYDTQIFNMESKN